MDKGYKIKATYETHDPEKIEKILEKKSEVGGNGFPGSNGNYTVGSGGGSGGLPGYYIVNSGLVTWTNLGAVAGFAI